MPPSGGTPLAWPWEGCLWVGWVEHPLVPTQKPSSPLCWVMDVSRDTFCSTVYGWVLGCMTSNLFYSSQCP